MDTKQADQAIAALRAKSAAVGKPIIFQSDLDIDDAYLHGTLRLRAGQDRRPLLLAPARVAAPSSTSRSRCSPTA